MMGSGTVRARLRAAFSADSESTDASASRLCRACVAVLGVERAAIIMMPRRQAGRQDFRADARPGSPSGPGNLLIDRGHLELVGASDPQAERIEELQITLGSGPGLTAFAERGPVWVPDLRAHQVAERWPVFASGLEAPFVGSMFCFPLQVGVISLGVLDLYRDKPGPFDPARLAAELQAVDAVTRLLLSTASESSKELVDLEPAPTNPQIHQAVGMVIVQLGVTAEEAYARLRAHAFAQSQSLNEVARSIVMRRMRLAPLSDGPAS